MKMHGKKIVIEWDKGKEMYKDIKNFPKINRIIEYPGD
jgi:uncharacterized pyridoxamine 5'-phosphate oxidase family protein